MGTALCTTPGTLSVVEREFGPFEGGGSIDQGGAVSGVEQHAYPPKITDGSKQRDIPQDINTTVLCFPVGSGLEKIIYRSNFCLEFQDLEHLGISAWW